MQVAAHICPWNHMAAIKSEYAATRELMSFCPHVLCIFLLDPRVLRPELIAQWRGCWPSKGLTWG